MHLIFALIHSFLCSIGFLKRREPEIPDLTRYDEEMDALEALVDIKSSDRDPADEPGE
jgi:hypothetical protein